MKVRLPLACAGVLALAVFALAVPGIPGAHVWLWTGFIAALLWILGSLLGPGLRTSHTVSSIMLKIQRIPALTAVLLIASAITIWIVGRQLEPDEASVPAPNRPSFAIKPAPDKFGYRYLEKSISVNMKASQSRDQSGKVDTCIDFLASGPGLEDSSWTLEIDADSGLDLSSGMTTKSERPGAPGQTHYTLTSSRISYPDAKASLCWANVPDMVIAKRASNIAISMPNFWVDQSAGPYSGRDNIPVHVQTELDDVGPDWAIDAGNAPEAQVSTFGKWVWKSVIGEIETRSDGSAALVQAHSVSEATEEHQNEFLSGILFGVAAAAGVTGFQELVNWYRTLDLTDSPHGEMRNGEGAHPQDNRLERETLKESGVVAPRRRKNRSRRRRNR